MHVGWGNVDAMLRRLDVVWVDAIRLASTLLCLASASCATATPRSVSDEQLKGSALVLTVDASLGPLTRIRRIDPLVDGFRPEAVDQRVQGVHDVTLDVLLEHERDFATLRATIKAVAIDGQLYAKAALVEDAATTTSPKLADRIQMILTPDSRPARSQTSAAHPPRRFLRGSRPEMNASAERELRGFFKRVLTTICASHDGAAKTITFHTYSVPSFDALIVDAVQMWRFEPAPAPTCFGMHFSAGAR